MGGKPKETVNSDIRVNLAKLKHIMQEHDAILMVNAIDVSLYIPPNGGVIRGLDKVARELTNVEQKRTGDRLE